MISKHINLFLIFLICLFTLPVLAQQKTDKSEVAIDKLEDGKIIINNRVYSVEKGTPPRITLVRENNEYIQNQLKGPKPDVRSWPLAFTIGDSVNNAVKKVLSLKRIEELIIDRSIVGRSLTIALYIDYTGKIKATEFTVPANLPITMRELDQINVYLKKRSYKMPENIRPDQIVTPLFANVFFRNLK